MPIFRGKNGEVQTLVWQDSAKVFPLPKKFCVDWTHVKIWTHGKLKFSR
jgi:hypothetical protein